LSVIFFLNSFGVTLDSGPMTIYDEDTCIGEAMLDSIRPGDDKFLPYGVDKQVVVTITDTNTLTAVCKTKISNGTLTLSRWRVYERKYEFDHKGSTHIQALFIEHRFQKGDEYELWDSAVPHSKTENFFRFQTRVNAGEITVFKVKERQLVHEAVSIRYWTRDQVESQFGAKYISKNTRDQLINELIPLQTKINAQQTRVNEENRLLSQAVSEQESARSSIVNRLTGYNNNYYHSGQQLWFYNEVEDSVLQTTQNMIDHEVVIRKYRASVRAETEILTKDQNLYETKLGKIQDDIVLIPK